MNRAIPPPIEPSQSGGPKTWRKHLTHQCIVMSVQRHHLDVMTYMLYQIHFLVIRVKWRSSKSARHRCPFDIPQEQWSSSSTQCSAHGIHGSIPGSSPLQGNWVLVCILLRLIPVSMGTGLMESLSISTPHTSIPLYTLFAVSSVTPTSCLQL